MRRKIVLTVFIISLALVVLSFGGAIHGLGDSLAVFRQWWAVAMVLSAVALLWGNWRIGLLGGAMFVLVAAPIAAGYLRSNTSGDFAYTLYQKNLLFKALAPNRIVRDIRAIEPDFVTLQEVSRGNMVVVWTLQKEFPTTLFCPFSGVGGVAILSKWPPVEGTENCVGNRGTAAVKVKTPDGEVWVQSVHLHWPFPHSQADQVTEITSQLGFLEDAPVVLGGDFNMVPWSHTVRAFERATGSRRAGPVLRTFEVRQPVKMLPNISLPIDHVLIPSGQGFLETRPLLGSDHFGLLLRFNL